MDLELLTLDEVRELSKLIDLLGTPVAIGDIGSCCRVLRGALKKYEQALVQAHEAARQYGD